MAGNARNNNEDVVIEVSVCHVDPTGSALNGEYVVLFGGIFPFQNIQNREKELRWLKEYLQAVDEQIKVLKKMPSKTGPHGSFVIFKYVEYLSQTNEKEDVLVPNELIRNEYEWNANDKRIDRFKVFPCTDIMDEEKTDRVLSRIPKKKNLPFFAMYYLLDQLPSLISPRNNMFKSVLVNTSDPKDSPLMLFIELKNLSVETTDDIKSDSLHKFTKTADAWMKPVGVACKKDPTNSNFTDIFESSFGFLPISQGSAEKQEKPETSEEADSSVKAMEVDVSEETMEKHADFLETIKEESVMAAEIVSYLLKQFEGNNLKLLQEIKSQEKSPSNDFLNGKHLCFPSNDLFKNEIPQPVLKKITEQEITLPYLLNNLMQPLRNISLMRTSRWQYNDYISFYIVEDTLGQDEVKRQLRRLYQ